MGLGLGLGLGVRVLLRVRVRVRVSLGLGLGLFMQEGCFMSNVSSFNQLNITDDQFFEVDSNLVYMLYFTPEWCPKHFSKMAKVVS